MTAQAYIFDLSVFPYTTDRNKITALPAGSEAARLFGEAIQHGLPCALISELPFHEAQQELRMRFGDTAHHLFSVVITNADFEAHGHKAPYLVALDQLGISADEVVAVAASPRAIAAAHKARIGIQRAASYLEPRQAKPGLAQRSEQRRTD